MGKHVISCLDCDQQWSKCKCIFEVISENSTNNSQWDMEGKETSKAYIIQLALLTGFQGTDLPRNCGVWYPACLRAVPVSDKEPEIYLLSMITWDLLPEALTLHFSNCLKQSYHCSHNHWHLGQLGALPGLLMISWMPASFSIFVWLSEPTDYRSYAINKIRTLFLSSEQHSKNPSH